MQSSPAQNGRERLQALNRCIRCPGRKPLQREGAAGALPGIDSETFDVSTARHQHAAPKPRLRLGSVKLLADVPLET